MKMLKIMSSLVAVATIAGGAQAASIVNLTGASQSVDLTTAANKNLANNGTYRSGSGASAIAYVFNEGVNLATTNATTLGLGIAGSSVQSVLLHYDRANGSGIFGGLTSGTATGSFTLQLGANETFAGIAGYGVSALSALADANALRDTDFLAGVTYPNTTFSTLLFRGTEGNLFGDRITLTTLGNLVQVDYRLTSTGASLDEVRFFVTQGAVPEPATWAMMIGGMGLVGGALRRRATASRTALA